MSDSSILTHADLRNMFKIGGELGRMRDVPAEVLCGHYLERMCRLVKAHALFLSLVETQPNGNWKYVSAVPFSFDQNYIEFFNSIYIGQSKYLLDPVEKSCFGSSECQICTTSDLMDPETWAEHSFRKSLQRGAELNDVMAAKATHDRQLNIGVVMFRQSGQPPFGEHERSATELLHTSLEWFFIKIRSELFQKNTQKPKSTYTGALSKRQAETLDLLLEGLSDKEIALRMDLAVTTVRQYVRGIFRVFSVQSRSELLANWLRQYREK